MVRTRWTLSLAIALAVVLAAALFGGVIAVDGETGGDSVLGTLTERVPLVDTPSTETEAADGVPFAFEEVANETGFEYDYRTRNRSTAEYEMVANAGVYVTDHDRDGWPDVLAVGGDRPVLFENTGGEFRRSNALPPLDSPMKSALFFDFNGDGWDDLLLFPMHGTPILLENVDGQYEKRDAGFDESLSVPTGATTLDFNGDGCLDVFVIQNGDWEAHPPQGIKNYSAWGSDDGHSNRLYAGNCSGSYTLTEATETGISGTRWSLAVSAADLNNDGRADIHVANDYNYDVVYMNRANGTFEQVRLPERTNQNGMSSEIADVNDDGRLDIFVTNIFLPDQLAKAINNILVYKNDGNNLLINQGDGEFVDRGREEDVQEGGWGWAATMSDFDNDGDEDLVHTTREVTFQVLMGGGEITSDERQRINRLPMYSYPIVREYRNGTFNRFHPENAGFEPADSRGAARLDFDRDGDMDLVVGTRSHFRLYENAGETGNSLQTRVETESGSTALGAEVTVTVGNETHWRTVRPYVGFLSQQERVTHVGVGTAETVSLSVTWPDGTTLTAEDVPANQRLVVRPSGVVRRVDLPRNSSRPGE